MTWMKAATVDTRSTISEWPVAVHSLSELPEYGVDAVRLWMKQDFRQYTFIYTPKRTYRKNDSSYYLGYGGETMIYQQESSRPVMLSRSQIISVTVRRELLNEVMTIQYDQSGEWGSLSISYVPTTYYLFDPFLNWTLGLPGDFEPILAERAHPRPGRLYQESLAMFNYSLAAYRLGEGFDTYQYQSREHIHKWMPWRKLVEEWLEVKMDRGIFRLHSYGYVTEYVYEKDRNSGKY